MNDLSKIDVEKYRALFAKVQNSENWKLPTNEFVTTSAKEAEEMRDAIVFFVGSATMEKTRVVVRPHHDALVYLETDGYVVTSKGYYATIGA